MWLAPAFCGRALGSVFVGPWFLVEHLLHPDVLSGNILASLTDCELSQDVPGAPQRAGLEIRKNLFLSDSGHALACVVLGRNV